MDCKVAHANDDSAIDSWSLSSIHMDSHATKRKAPKAAKTEIERPIRQPKTNAEEDGNGVSDHKRLQARNRAAATKCRRRKKAWIGDMEDELANLRSRNTELQAWYADLLQEISQLKTHVLNHAMCADPNIVSWVDSANHGYANQCTTTMQGASWGDDFRYLDDMGETYNQPQRMY